MNRIYHIVFLCVPALLFWSARQVLPSNFSPDLHFLSDTLAPIAMCKDTVEVYLDEFGEGIADVMEFDAGSFDENSPVSLACRRLLGECDGGYNAFGPEVTFCCDDYLEQPIKVLLAVEDQAGNNSGCISHVMVLDTFPPGITCPIYQVVNYEEYYFADVYAYELEFEAVDNCFDNLVFSYSENPSDDVLALTCEDACGPWQTYSIWVTDPEGNQDSCHSTIIVSLGAEGLCECFPEISGEFRTENGVLIDSVTCLGIEYMGQPIVVNGSFGYEPSPGNPEFIEPEKTDNPANGVSSIDLVAIKKHLLGIESLDSPYKLIAADANNSGGISTMDVVELKQLILDPSIGLANNDSWRFVVASYEFPDSSNPWLEAFPEAIYYDDPVGFFVNQDFIGVKIGDVNGSVN